MTQEDVPDEKLGCRVCRTLLRPKNWGGVECSQCGSVSTTVLPTPDEIAAYYHAYNETYLGGGQSEGQNQIRYARRYLEIVRTHVGGGTLIDVGCSTNPFPNIAEDSGFDVTVLDYIKPADLSSRVKYIQGSIDDENALLGHQDAFDVVTAWAVLEHLPQPRQSAKSLASLCRRGGLLFLSTPEIGTFLTNNSIGRSSWFYPPEHLNLVSPSGVKMLFEEQGCVLETWGRLELTPVRYLARYGIGFAEAMTGIAIKSVLPEKWQHLRDTRVHAFNGITYFILRKT